MGFDAKRKCIVNLIESNIIDPVKVVKSALRYGSGLASILLTAEAAIIDEDMFSKVRIHEQIKIWLI